MRSIAALLLAAAALAAGGTTAAAAPVKPVTLTIVVGTHGVASGPKKFTVKRHARVVIRVKSPIGEAVHLHGYDLEKPVRSKTAWVVIPFTAKVAGVFEVELHLTETRGLRIGLVTVK